MQNSKIINILVLLAILIVPIVISFYYNPAIPFNEGLEPTVPRVTDPTPTTQSTDTNYEKIKDNYDMQFHDDVETIKKQNDMYDLNFGEVRVKDQNGNMIILPKTESQGSVTFYQPGEFPFGASTYVPNYEDSVYLSSVGYRTFLGNANPSNCDAICNTYNDFKLKMDIQCGKSNHK
jgi:hypothetical protein